MLMFDVVEGAEGIITTRCVSKPTINTKRESLKTPKSVIEIACDTFCPTNTKEPCVSFDVLTEIVYDPIF